jgi:hypothetical protein
MECKGFLVAALVDQVLREQALPPGERVQKGAAMKSKGKA